MPFARGAAAYTDAVTGPSAAAAVGNGCSCAWLSRSHRWALETLNEMTVPPF